MTDSVDTSRRKILRIATTVTGLTALGLASRTLIESWSPNVRARILAAPVEVDVSKLEPGAMLKVVWRGKPVFVVHRTSDALSSLAKHEVELDDPASERSEQPLYAANSTRSIRPEILVLIGSCTHLGCTPLGKFTPGDLEMGSEWPGGFYCPCHGARFDLSGRVFRNGPAPSNLAVPPHRFVDDATLVIGEDPQAPTERTSVPTRSA
jgi:ubiquinol-cytochrome c reductase iron-sulfur subunit